MARTGDPHSADAQFYINLADNLALDPKPTRWGYAVFGEVIQGLEIVDKIGHQVTGIKGGMQDVPIEDVVIRKVTVLKTPVAR
jgi:peptidyl-prolyl cis-trans isomerase B (cyclophilin B)